MNCHEYQEAIVDFARRALDEDGERRLRSHLDGCAACSDRLRLQILLTDRLKAVAAAAADEVPSSALETELLEQFVSEHATPAGATVPASTTVRRLSPWIKVAAAIVCAAVPLAWWLLPGSTRREHPARASIDLPRQQAAVPTPSPAPPTAAAIPSPAPVTKPPRPRRPARVIHPEGFIPLPASAGLPAFESGEIVRMEVPLTWLSTYGVQVSPDLGNRPVQADLLVGQDGHPRAIRLVTNPDRVRPGPARISTEDSRSRQ
jgi:Putative zinc-finger